MRPTTELLLYRLAWRADQLFHPTLNNLMYDFEYWCSRTGCLDRIQELEALGFLERNPDPDARGAGMALTEAARKTRSPRAHPPTAWKRKWNGIWHQVLFDLEAWDVPTRRELHKALKYNGFGCLQGSVWIHPYAAKSIQKCGKNIPGRPENLLLLESRSRGKHTDRWMVEDAWDWQQIETGYREYFDLIHAYTPPKNIMECRDWVRREKKYWNRAVEADPMLPEKLLPDGYWGKEAWTQRQTHLGQLDLLLESLLQHKP